MAHGVRRLTEGPLRQRAGLPVIFQVGLELRQAIVNSDRLLLESVLQSDGTGAFKKFSSPAKLSQAQSRLGLVIHARALRGFALQPVDLPLHTWPVAIHERDIVENIVNDQAIQLFCNGLFTDGFCLGELCCLSIGHPKTLIRDSMVRDQSQSLLACLDRFLRLSRQLVLSGEVNEGNEVVRVHLGPEFVNFDHLAAFPGYTYVIVSLNRELFPLGGMLPPLKSLLNVLASEVSLV